MTTIRTLGSSPIIACLAILLNLAPLTANFGTPQGDARKQPIHKENLINSLKQLRRGDSQTVLIDQVRARGVDFELTVNIESELRSVGAGSPLIAAVRNSLRPGSSVKPAAISRTVTLQVFVTDNNLPVNGVLREQFNVYENGVLQSISSFTHEDVPIIYGLAIDTSGSLRGEFNQVIDAAKAIIKSNKKGDESFIERFISSDKIETVQDFTSNKDALTDALDTLYIEGGQTAVVDGIYLATEHVAQYKRDSQDNNGRRALIVITDGLDGPSYYSESQLFELLRKGDVQVYVVAFVNELGTNRVLGHPGSREKAVDFINRVASESGGRAFFAQSISELPEIAGAIGKELRSGYVISYESINKIEGSDRQSIKVEVTGGSAQNRRVALVMRQTADGWRRVDK